MNVRNTVTLLMLATCCLFFVSCEIEESTFANGKIFVELHDDQGAVVTGARIWRNGVATSQFTPDTLRGLAAGSYLIATSKPGFLQSSQRIVIDEGEIATVSLLTSAAPFASVELTDAPDGTALIVDNEEFAIVPPQLIGMSVGSWNLSAYLTGHATNTPARWNITLAEGDTTRIAPEFTPLANGSTIGSLAPVFSLPSDLDSAIFRLQDYRGKIILLSFFFYDCVPCLDEFPHIQTVYADEEYAGWIEFFGVDGIDPWFRLNTYKEGHPTLGIQFPLLWDQGGFHRTQSYNVAVHPTNFLIDPTGTIRFRWGGISENQLRGAIESLISEFE